MNIAKEIPEPNQEKKRFRAGFGRGERGVSLVLASFGLFVLLGMAGLVIDLGWLYAVRSEAQSAADAAALAGAQTFVTSGFTSGLVSQAVAQSVAAQQAAAIGDSNLVGGLAARIASSGFSASCPPAASGDGCFDFSNPDDPRITVVVQRTAARGDAVPVFFMRIFGVQSVDVTAQASAEAFNPSGGGPPVSSICLKPWLVPNCDPLHVVGSGDPNANSNCPVTGGFASYFVNPTTGAIVHPGPVSSGGAIGEFMVVKPGNPLAATAPSQYYPVFLPPEPNGFPASCPSCGDYPGGSGPSSAALYRANIACCNLTPTVSATQQIQPITGDMTGPTAQGVDCLIHETNGTGMDVLNRATSPFQILAGSNNPLVLSGVVPVNTPVAASDSIVTVPLYSGVQLCPGQSCPSTVQVGVVGFLQLFLKDETRPQGTVEAYVMNITGGPPGGVGSGATPVAGNGASPIAVRLIHP
jgi:Flp pilus assembly protein TadG